MKEAPKVAIKHKALGQTNERVPEVGNGTWLYKGGSGLLRRAVELGAALIDTAEYSGSEDVVRETIAGVRDQVFVATKISHWRYGDVIASAEVSLRKLGVERIDLYQVHWANAAVPLAETMAAMEDLADQGKVRYVGVSSFSIGEMRRAQWSLRNQRLVSNQPPCGVFERTIEPRILRLCQQNSTTVLACSPLGRSRDASPTLSSVSLVPSSEIQLPIIRIGNTST